MTSWPYHATLSLPANPKENIVLTEQFERVPVAEDYLSALGRATYNFSYLEWGVIWLTEALQPGFLQMASTMTAGNIEEKFSSVVKKLDKTDPDKARLKILARNFSDLVPDRNSLMHGNPHTALSADQRLLYDGKHGRKDWTLDSMRDFSSRTATASIEVGKLLHNGRLQRYHAAKSPPDYVRRSSCTVIPAFYVAGSA